MTHSNIAILTELFDSEIQEAYFYLSNFFKQIVLPEFMGIKAIIYKITKSYPAYA